MRNVLVCVMVRPHTGITTSRKIYGNKLSICAPDRDKTRSVVCHLSNVTQGEDHAHRGMHLSVKAPREWRVDTTSRRVVPNEAFSRLTRRRSEFEQEEKENKQERRLGARAKGASLVYEI